MTPRTAQPAAGPVPDSPLQHCHPQRCQMVLRVVSIALVMALLNLKDAFWVPHGPSLTIPTQAKPGLFARIRNVVPLALIVESCTVTLGVHKLQEAGGRRLKLLSGVMMLALSLVLLLAPTWLAHIGTMVSILGGALAATGVIVLTERWRERHAVQK